MLTRLYTKLAVAHNDRGASAVEYGLLVALIAAVIIGVVFILGGTLENVFSSVNADVAKGADVKPGAGL